MGLANGMFSPQAMTSLGKNWGWFLVWGILLVVAGAYALAASVLTTMITVLVLGALLLIAGVVIALDAFSFWRQSGGTFFLHLLMGILYIIAGAYLIEHPTAAAVSLTLLLGVFYLVLGAFRISYSLTSQWVSWGWWLLNGVITFLLGVLILIHWPESSLFILGIFVGVDLFFLGWAYIMIALSARSIKHTL